MTSDHEAWHAVCHAAPRVPRLDVCRSDTSDANQRRLFALTDNPKRYVWIIPGRILSS